MSEIKMNYQVAAAIYDSYLYNLNNVGGFSLKEIFDAYYRSKRIDPTKRDDDFIKFTSMINEAQNAGKSLEEITEYLNQKNLEEARNAAKREEKMVSIIEDGNERGVRIESTAFDPSGKSNISSKFGSSDFEFNDDSTKYLNPEKEEGYMNSKIAAKAGDKNTSGIGTRDTFETPEPLIIGEPVDTLDQGVNEENIPSFGETNAPSSMDNYGKNVSFGDDDDEGPTDEESHGPFSF